MHLAGTWEFPGGKCEAGETLRRGAARELERSSASTSRLGDESSTTTHEYPDRRVELHFLRCALEGEPVPQLGQEMRWVPREELARWSFRRRMRS